MSEPDQTTPLSWTRASPGEQREENREVVREISRLLKAGETGRVMNLLRRWHPRDLVELMVQLPLKRARALFVALPTGPAAKVIAELNDDFRAALLEDVTIERIVAILDSLDPEDAADALDELPEEVEARVLPQLRESAAVRELQLYGEESAGGIMTRKLIAFPADWTVGQAVAELRRRAGRVAGIDSLYVIDPQRRLLGGLTPQDLLLAGSDTPLAQILRRDVVAVGPNVDQEEVVRLSEREGLATVAVVDVDGRLLGHITPGELQRVVREEAEEDMHLLGGVSPKARPDEPVIGIVRSRLPWLAAGLLGATISGSVVGAFEEQIAEAAILASFIPIVMSMAGNAGIQAATVAIQGLATGTLWIGDLGARLGREMLGALLNGIAAALLLALIVLAVSQYVPFDSPLRLALTASVALVGVTLLAVAMGASVPILLHHLRVDPAMATGVFITTGNDIISVLVFFLVVGQLYLP